MQKKLAQNPSYHIFLSYSSKDIETAKKLQNYFSQIYNVKVFLAETELIIGKLSTTIIQTIRKSDLFLVLYSKNSHNSTYVQQEIGIAIDQNKPIIPILLDSLAKPDAMLQGINYLTIYDETKKQEQMPKLYNYIVQESTKKAQGQAILVLGAIIGLGYLLSKK